MMPVMALRLLEAITFSASVVKAFTEKCVVGIEANKEHCEEMIEKSLAMVTALAPVNRRVAADHMCSDLKHRLTHHGVHLPRHDRGTWLGVRQADLANATSRT
jgi:fumarate hydratase class II